MKQINFEVPNFEVDWSPLRGGYISTSTSHNKINVYNVTHVGNNYCPKWSTGFKQCGSTFAFGGKLIKFGIEYVEDMKDNNANKKPATDKTIKKPPKIDIIPLKKSPSIIKTAKEFENIIKSIGQKNVQGLTSYINKQLTTLKNNSKTINDVKLKNENKYEVKMWELMDLLFNKTDVCKKNVKKYLGFSLDPPETKTNAKPKNITGNNLKPPPKKEETIDDDAFFDNISNDNILDENQEVKVDEKKDVMDDETSEVNVTEINKIVKQAIILKDFDTAVEYSLKCNNIADALVFGYYSTNNTIDNGDKNWNMSQEKYFETHKNKFICNDFKYIALNDFDNLVKRCDLTEWKDILCILLTYIPDKKHNPKLFSLLNVLGSRLYNNNDIESAIFCYALSCNLTQLLLLWSNILNDSNRFNKKKQDNILYNVLLKAYVYINSIYYVNNHDKRDTLANSQSLSKVFCEYTNLIANQGSIAIARTFLTDGAKLMNINIDKNPEMKRLLHRISINLAPPKKIMKQPPPLSVNQTGGGYGRGRSSGQRRGRPQERGQVINQGRGQNSGPMRGGGPTRGRGRGVRSRGQSRGRVRGRGRGGQGRGRGISRSRSDSPQSEQSSYNDSNMGSNNLQGRNGINNVNNGPSRSRGGARGRVRGRGRGQPRPRDSNNSIGNRRPGPPPNNRTSNSINDNASDTSDTIQSRRSGPVRGRPTGARRTRVKRGGPMGRGTSPSNESVTSNSSPNKPTRMRGAPRGRSRGRVRGRGRGRGPSRGRGSGRGRGGSQYNNQPNNEYDNDSITGNNVQQNNNNNNNKKGSTSGSGYFGQTRLNDENLNNVPLPDDANDLCEVLRSKLADMASTANDVSMNSHDYNKLQHISDVYESTLFQNINNNDGKISYNCYSILKDMIYSLQSHQYTSSKKKIKDLIKDAFIFKNNKKWIMVSKDLINIAEKYEL